MLGLFHHAKERREVRDSGQVGIAEFDTTRGGKRGRHHVTQG
jgi:hypothetical protein